MISRTPETRSILERHPYVALTILTLILSLLILTTLEFGFRISRDIIKGSPWIARAENVDDDELGWVLNPRKGIVNKTNACGESVVRRPPVSPYLLKLQRTQPNTVIPVLFLGDSFTQGTETSSDGLYYEVFEKNGAGRFAVSAAGGGGFGTAQEFLFLQKVYPLMKPEIVFWQLTSNDVGENVFIGTDIGTVQKPRPYFDAGNDRFVILNPALWLLQHSELSKYLYGEFQKNRRAKLLEIAPPAGQLPTAQNVPQTQVTRQGLEVMEHLLAKARKAYPGTWFVGFNVSEQFDDDYQAIFLRQGAAYLPKFSQKMQAVAAGRRLDCAPVDSHWNHEGNRVAAMLLLDFVGRATVMQNGRLARPEPVIRP